MQVNKETLEYLLYQLESIKKFGPNRPEVGICRNVLGDTIPNTTYLLEIFDYLSIEKWELYTGLEEFPVPSFVPSLSCYECYDRLDKWSKRSKYGKARWDLVDYLINQIKKELGDA